MSMRLLGQVLTLLLLLLSAAASASAQGTLHTLRTNGPAANRLNFVFIAEGYTNGQTAKFTNEANAVLQKMLTTPPYSEYAKYLNAFAIFVASAEAGSDHPASNTTRNTYFNSTYDSYGTPCLITIPPNDRDETYDNGQGKVDALLQSLCPDYDIALLLVNDTVYGGSGGRTPMASVDAESAEIAIHEIGHSFADLGDEYTRPYPGFPDIEEPNTTQQTNRALIKWNAWMAPAIPVPTPDTPAYNNAVGLFEGAHYHETGWYRPKRDCKMRTLGVAFCEVCREAIVKSLYDVVGPIDFVSPPTNAIASITNAGATTFGVTLLQPATHRLMVEWFVNDTLRASGTNATLTLAAWDLPPGTNTVRAEVFDATTYVRSDPLQLLREDRSWQVRSTVVSPPLGIQQTNNVVTITWPPTAVGFRLQSKTNLDPGIAWLTISVITNQPGALFVVTDLTRYFRLWAP